jgi:hypothetical protein
MRPAEAQLLCPLAPGRDRLRADGKIGHETRHKDDGDDRVR